MKVRTKAKNVLVLGKAPCLFSILFEYAVLGNVLSLVELNKVVCKQGQDNRSLGLLELFVRDEVDHPPVSDVQDWRRKCYDISCVLLQANDILVVVNVGLAFIVHNVVEVVTCWDHGVLEVVHSLESSNQL